MATYADLKPHHRLFMSGYPFSRYTIVDNPAATLAKPLSECQFALITSAGLRMETDTPFSHATRHTLGDTSFRAVPNDIDPHALIEDHSSSSFDHAGVKADKNLAFPLDRFRELLLQGKIGGLNWRHFSFMGSIINPRALVDETARQCADLLVADAVDCVFLTPV
jgi:hypothetical protein